MRSRFERSLVSLWFGSIAATAIVDVGLTSAGYVAGEPLRGGSTLRAGVGLPPALAKGARAGGSAVPSLSDRVNVSTSPNAALMGATRVVVWSPPYGRSR